MSLGGGYSQLCVVPVGYVPLNKVCFLFMSESRAGYQNHPLWKRCVFFSTFWLWNQWVWFFPYTTSTLKSLAIHTIWSALCDLFTNHTIFCTKSHLFLCQKKRNTKTAQPNRFQILLKVTNQISGQMDVKKRPCPGVGVPCHPSYNVCRCRHCCNLAKGGCLLSRFHFMRCHYFLDHVACRNLPWQGLSKVAIELCNFGLESFLHSTQFNYHY